INDRGQSLVITADGQSGFYEFAAQVWLCEVVRKSIVLDALVRAGEQGEVVWLARVRLGEGIGHEGALRGQGVDVRGGRLPDDSRVGVVLLHYHHNVVRPRDGRHNPRL